MDNYTDRIADEIFAALRYDLGVAFASALMDPHPTPSMARWQKERAAERALAAVWCYVREADIELSPADYLAAASTVARRLTDALTPTNSGETE